jgi:hypothetical protein
MIIDERIGATNSKIRFVGFRVMVVIFLEGKPSGLINPLVSIAIATGI